ncbi:MAG: FAD-binding protein [Oscillospiraceae bacterium]|nr:FAD-binding protein [Oscillospiraceae bacterium]
MKKDITASFPGFGGPVSVTVSVEDGRLIAVSAYGPGETPGFSDEALAELPKKILAAGGTDDVDAITGATITSTAILRSAEKALEEAGLSKSGETTLRMQPGVYSGEGFGFDRIEPIHVEVTVSETEIKNIEVVQKDTLRETPQIFVTAEENLIPRMISSQDLTVDAITGATASSSGIRKAVERALEKAIEAGGGNKNAIKAFYKPHFYSDKKVELDYDIVVAGMGGAGCAAAMSAAEGLAERGLPVSVLAIDSAAKYGGTAATCGEMFAVNPPEHKKKYNNGEDYCDAESLWNNWIYKFTRGKCREDLVKLFFDESGKTIDWLSFKHGYILCRAKSGFGNSPWRVKYQYTYKKNYEPGRDYPAGFVPSGNRMDNVTGYFDGIVKDYTNLGGKYMLETESVSLLYDRENRRVTGLKARGADGTEYTVHAKAVILAGGGFGGNYEMEKKYLSNEFYPLSGEWYLYGMAQNKGQMLESAIENGAACFNMGMPPCVHLEGPDGSINAFPVHKYDGKVTFTTKYDIWSSNYLPAILGTAKNALSIGRDGRRYYDEGGTFEFWKPGPKRYNIVGSDYVDSIAEKGFPGEKGSYIHYTALLEGVYPANAPAPEIYEALDAAIEAGYVFKADTIEELAGKIGVPGDVLVEEVKKYSECCRTGVDPYFGKEKQFLVPTLERGPYYAVRCRPIIYATLAALDINTDINVLDRDGNVMNGLYACGNDSGGVLYAPDAAYAKYGGVALGWAYTSGRLAGQSAAKYIESLK